MRTLWLARACEDSRLSPYDYRVYSWCNMNLDESEERPMKILPLSFAIGMKKDTVISCLRLLVALRYIAKGARPKGEGRRYRLLPAPLPEHKARAA